MSSDIQVLNSACFTGHRQQKFPFDTNDEFVMGMFLSTIYMLSFEIYMNFGIRTFYTGMQTGMDIWAAQQIIRLRKVYKDIHLIGVSPYESEINSRHGKDHADYIDVRDACDEFIIVSPDFTPSCFHLRNRYMVDHSDIVIAAITDSGIEGSGTSSTLRYARRCGKHIHAINLTTFTIEHLC